MSVVFVDEVWPEEYVHATASFFTLLVSICASAEYLIFSLLPPYASHFLYDEEVSLHDELKSRKTPETMYKIEPRIFDTIIILIVHIFKYSAVVIIPAM
jgi:hypothetical protein